MYEEFEKWIGSLRVAVKGKTELQGFSLENKELMYIAWLAGKATNRDFSGLEACASINLIDPYASPEVAASVISDCVEAIKYAGSKV